MNLVVLTQNDAVLGVYSSVSIAKAFAYKHWYDRYRTESRLMADFNYRYLEFILNTDTLAK